MELVAILKHMQEKQASDLHLKSNSQPIIRRNGKLYLLDKNAPILSHEDISQMINKIINSEQKQLFVKHKNVDFGYHFNNIGRFRFCIFSQKGTIRVVVRAINQNIPSFEDLNLPKSLKKLADYKNGLILITGSTGSGKSTTAASLLNLINNKYSYHILTIEDPIEYVIHDCRSCVSQRELYLDYNNKAEAFRAALRQDPDVIFFGEIRDAESMSVALQAAESGHLVISTLHTSTTLETIDRCLSFFEKGVVDNMRYQLINTLRAVVSQRLVPIVNGNSSIPILEIFYNTIRMKQALTEKNPQDEIYKIVEESYETYGMQTFDQHIITLIEKGLITKDVGLQFATRPKDVKLKCDGLNISGSNSVFKNKTIKLDSDDPDDESTSILKIKQNQ